MQIVLQSLQLQAAKCIAPGKRYRENSLPNRYSFILPAQLRGGRASKNCACFDFDLNKAHLARVWFSLTNRGRRQK